MERVGYADQKAEVEVKGMCRSGEIEVINEASEDKLQRDLRPESFVKLKSLGTQRFEDIGGTTVESRTSKPCTPQAALMYESQNGKKTEKRKNATARRDHEATRNLPWGEPEKHVTLVS